MSGTQHSDFQEIANCGGRIVIRVVTHEDQGARSVSFGFEHNRPVAASIIAIWALPPGIPLAPYPIELGMGVEHQSPCLGAIPIFIGSDTEGMHAHQCPRCRGYWRSRNSPRVCPYCGTRAGRQNFLTDAQSLYVQHCCSEFERALGSARDGEYFIDLDAAADAAETGSRLNFYFSSEAQQTKFTCNSCEDFLDVLGEVAICSACGTLNASQILKMKIKTIRENLNSDKINASSGLRDGVSLFDAFVRKYIDILLRFVPLSKRRKASFEKKSFHDIDRTSEAIESAYDIDILKGIEQAQRREINIMFARRHLHEHNGGIVDERYIQQTGDRTVRSGQLVREDRGRVHDLLSSIQLMIGNLHDGYHELIPPIQEPIDYKISRDRMRKS